MRPLLLLACLACSEVTTPTSFDLVAASLDVIAGADQVDTVGRELPTAVRVLVTAPVEGGEGETAPVPGQIVNFVVVQGGGTVFAGVAITNDSGVAQEIWTLGPTAGEQRLEARAVDPDTGDPLVFAIVTATAIPGPITTAILRDTVGFVDEYLDVRPTVTDAFGNPIPWTVTGTGATVAAAAAMFVAPGVHQVHLVARDDTVATAEVRAFLDPRPLNLTLQTRCRDGATLDSIAHTMVRADAWVVAPGALSTVWIDGGRRAMVSDVTWIRVRWHTNGTVDTGTTIDAADNLNSGQLIAAIAPEGAPDSVRFHPAADAFLPRTGANRWAAPHVPARGLCEFFATGDSVVVEATASSD